MNSKRQPAPPPQLPGFTFVEVLGSGGFADVYLYQQQMPRRRVAVKVLLPDRMAGGSAEQFAAEANVMALLSTHPAIVTIYQAGVSGDGRPYLVMEYCPRPNLQVRSRASAFSVAEALRVGVQVAAAVETAHRAGILHRDIKPANILVTEYNRPALTDFGIATETGAEADSSGMSIPWSPPESFADVPESGVRSDVWALGATVYTLLAGRSPFEVPGGRNGGAELIERIETQPLQRIDRADVPESLQVVLDRAMSKRPGDRYDSAVAFARALQKVQIELAHSVTPIDILDDAPPEELEDDEDDELTRVRGIVSIEPQTNPAAGNTRQRPQFEPVVESVPDHTVVRHATPVATPDQDDATVLRGPATIPPSAPTAQHAPAAPAQGPVAPTAEAPAPAPAAPRSRRGLWIGLAVGGGILLIVIVVALFSVFGPTPEPQPTDTGTPEPQDPLGGFIAPPGELTGTVSSGQATFTWTNPDPQDGDVYVWYPYTLDTQGDSQTTEEATVTVPVDAGGVCIAVQVVRDGGRYSDPAKECVTP
ncbi:serine/threonine-protein kinase [Microbacterium sp. bgisy189]|uniref:serine/threonine-protein kinase n=1 Tax=Microbacterium sp. bgisy189 TaxID=3413798 RepID=UPI003EB9704C